jgi:5-methylcytosine-specific restriction endonuclease McrA
MDAARNELAGRMAGLCEEHQTPRQKNGVCPKCYFREWYARNREDVIARTRQWKREHPEERKDSKRRWLRKRRMAAQGKPVGLYTYDDVFDLYGDTCYLCLRPVDRTLESTGYYGPAIDHLIPISRGGIDSIENVRPCHRGCNSH